MRFFCVLFTTTLIILSCLGLQAQEIQQKTPFSQNEVKSAQCHTACGYLGYDEGRHQNGMCECVDLRPFGETVNKKRLFLPRKKAEKAEDEGKKYKFSYTAE